MIHSTKCKVPVDFVMNLNCFDGYSVEPSKFLTDKIHVVDRDLTTISFDTVGDLKRPKLEKWIQILLWENLLVETQLKPFVILRLKGLVKFENDRSKYVINGVNDLYDIIKGAQLEDEETMVNRIVVIGKNLDIDAIETSFIESQGCVRLV
jgi:G3E family GTPase